MSLETIRDESVKKLAKTLRASGMAASDSEAIRMAESMSSTSQKVQQGYNSYEESQKESGLRDDRPVSYDKSEGEESVQPITEEGVPARDAPEVVEEQPSESVNLDAKELYAQQKDIVNSSYKGELDDETSLNELMAEDEKSIYGKQFDLPEGDEPEPVLEPEPTQSFEVKPAKEMENLDLDSESEDDDSEDEDSTEEEQSEPEPQQEETNPASEQFKDEDFEVEKTREIEAKKKSDAERKEAYQKMAESKIDLSEVFKFG